MIFICSCARMYCHHSRDITYNNLGTKWLLFLKTIRWQLSYTLSTHTEAYIFYLSTIFTDHIHWFIALDQIFWRLWNRRTSKIPVDLAHGQLCARACERKNKKLWQEQTFWKKLLHVWFIIIHLSNVCVCESSWCVWLQFI